MLIFYRMGLWLYAFFIKILSPFYLKARKFSEGRKEWKNKFKIAFKENKEMVIWFHTASLGEFEQGRPIIERLKQEQKKTKILLTFFSPSGFDIREHYEHADWVFYLPLDSPKNAQFFIDTVKPALVIFIKYEFWYYFLKTLKAYQIPTLMVSSIFRENQLFFHWAVGPFYQKVLKAFYHFFVQDQKSKKLIAPIVGNRVTVSGDTRFDRVLAIANEKIVLSELEFFKGQKRLVVLGSTWSSDLVHLIPFMKNFQSAIKFVIAPHNIDESEIKNVENKIEKTIRYSKALESSPDEITTSQIMIIDNIGLLSTIYGYADFAFIGGAFRGALHNTLEAAVYGIPVGFGEHQSNAKFMEALGLVKNGGGFTFSSTDELISKFTSIYENKSEYDQMAISAEEFVKKNSGATELIIYKINELLQ